MYHCSLKFQSRREWMDKTVYSWGESKEGLASHRRLGRAQRSVWPNDGCALSCRCVPAWLGRADGGGGV